MAAVKDSSRTRYNGRKLSEDAIRTILTRTDLTMRQVADLYGVAPETAQKIRRGDSYSDVLPELPRIKRTQQERTTGPRCNECVHDLDGRCTLGFPERIRSNAAAVVCAAYATGRVL